MALTATGEKDLIQGILPVMITSQEAIEAGDEVTADGYKADASAGRYAEFTAAHNVASGKKFVAYRLAYVGRFSGGVGAGTCLFLSDTPGDVAETKGTVPQVVGVEVSATEALLAPGYLGVSELLFLPDNKYLYFGTGLDVSIRWDEAKLEILPVSDGVGSINIGNGTKDIDFKVFLGDAGDYVRFDVGEGRVDFVDAELRFAEAAKLEFRDDGIFIYSATDGNLTLSSDGTGIGAINLITAGYAGTIQMYGYVRLLRTDVDGDAEAEVWWDNSENLIKYYNGTAVRTLVDEETAQSITGLKVFDGGIKIGTTNHLEFRDAQIFIYSHADGCLTIATNGTGVSAINLITGDYAGTIQCYGYLRLLRTDTDGVNEGEMWYDESEDLIKYYSSAVRTLVDEETAQTITGLKVFDGGAKIGTTTHLEFRDAEIYIYSHADGCLTIQTNSTGVSAINLGTGGAGTYGTIQCYGYLRLLRTDTDGDAEGELWYDDSENVLKFYDGTQVRTVTSA